jgi:hypothetical protein
MGRKPVFRQDVSCPSCGSHRVVKSGKSAGRGRTFIGFHDISYQPSSSFPLSGSPRLG